MNDRVLVRVTPRGEAIIKKAYEKVPWPAPELKRDADGYTAFQLWHLFELFGAYIHNGCEVPFETNIIFPGP